jgi:hypothetical protein
MVRPRSVGLGEGADGNEPAPVPPGSVSMEDLRGTILVANGVFEDLCRKDLFTPAGLGDPGFIGDEKRIESDRISRRVCDDCEARRTVLSNEKKNPHELEAALEGVVL